MAKPKRTAYEIAITGRCSEHSGDAPAPYHCGRCWVAPAGRTTETGYVLGDFACAKGKWFYEYTHLPTGLHVTIHPAPERLAPALAELAQLAAGTHPRSGYIADATAGRAWGGVIIGPVPRFSRGAFAETE